MPSWVKQKQLMSAFTSALSNSSTTSILTSFESFTVAVKSPPWLFVKMISANPNFGLGRRKNLREDGLSKSGCTSKDELSFLRPPEEDSACPAESLRI